MRVESAANRALGPSTRYQGSKRKLLAWLADTFASLRFKTVADVMAGTGSVAYLMKSLGKTVIANDYLHSNHQTLVAFIENRSTCLSDDDVRWLLTRHRGVRYTSFVQDVFANLYFKREENDWLDLVAGNITALTASDKATTKYKQALARHAVIQACLMKRPFNLFHRDNLYIRTSKVQRSFGNKTTWDTPFPVLFERLVAECNRCVFDNGRLNRALHDDVLDVRNDSVDLVYIDPPYFRSEHDRAHSNYRLLYHFVEGFAQYADWPDLIDSTTNLKSLLASGFSTEPLYVCARNDFRHTFLRWLRQVLSMWPNAQIVMSYKHPGTPGYSAITRALEETGRRVTVKRKTYWYALNRKNGTPKHNIELLFIAK